MRQQAGAGVHLNHCRALASQRPCAVFQHHVYPRNVQAHHARGQGCGGGHTGVDKCCHVHRYIAVALDQYTLVFGGHRIGGEAYALQFQKHLGTVARSHQIQRKIFPPSTPWVAVDLQLGQLIDGVHAIALDMQRVSACRRHYFFTHYEQAVLLTGDVFLHNHRAAPTLAVRQVVGRFHFSLLHQFQRHTASVVAVVGLDDYR